MLCAHIIDTNMTMCVSDHLRNPSGTRYIKNAANVSRRIHWKSDAKGRTVDNSYSFSETRHVVVVVVPSTLCYSSREKLITRERAETVRNPLGMETRRSNNIGINYYFHGYFRCMSTILQYCAFRSLTQPSTTIPRLTTNRGKCETVPRVWYNLRPGKMVNILQILIIRYW